MSKKLSFLETIFSYKNKNKYHNQICILGIKFNIRKNEVDLKYYYNLPIQNNKIVFRSVHSAYNCNPKYIAEEILRQGLDYELVWIADKYVLKYIDSFPKNLKLVMDSTQDALKEYASAKIWIDNEIRYFIVEKGLYKKEKQVYINTWHGSLGIKKCGFDRNDIKKTRKNSKDAIVIDKEQVDFLISNSTFETNFYKRRGYPNSKILELGHPRNDIFFVENKDIKRKVYKYFGIPENKKIVIYAPTFRETSDLSCYKLDFSMLRKCLQEKFNGDWVVINRMHPNLNDCKEQFESDGVNISDASNYPDMQELSAAADILITDYSSCIFDYMLQYKPGFIFATDIKEYDWERGFYYPLSSTPFPVASCNEELAENIKCFDNEKYLKEVEQFLKDKGCIDDGQASKRAVEIIKTIIEQPDKLDEKIEEFVR